MFWIEKPHESNAFKILSRFTDSLLAKGVRPGVQGLGSTARTQRHLLPPVIGWRSRLPMLDLPYVVAVSAHVTNLSCECSRWKQSLAVQCQELVLLWDKAVCGHLGHRALCGVRKMFGCLGTRGGGDSTRFRECSQEEVTAELDSGGRAGVGGAKMDRRLRAGQCRGGLLGEASTHLPSPPHHS